MNKKILQTLINQQPQLSEDNLEKVLLSLLNETSVEEQYDANYTQNLTRVYKKLLESHDFQVGDLVKWKPGLKNKKRPYVDQPAIVVQLLETPIINRNEETGSTYYREPLDIILGLFDDEGEFLMFYYDKRRFEPYSEKE